MKLIASLPDSLMSFPAHVVGRALRMVAQGLLLTIVVRSTASSQSPVPDPGPVPRQLGAEIAAWPDSLGWPLMLRPLTDGRVLLDDLRSRRLYLTNSRFDERRILADSTGAAPHLFPGPVGGLISFRRDSSLLVDPSALTMVLIGPSGEWSRTMAIPDPAAAIGFTGLQGRPGGDEHGGLIYLGALQPATGSHPTRESASAQALDSQPVMRVTLRPRHFDTLAFVRVPTPHFEWREDALGNPTRVQVIDPLPVLDAWAILSDGTLAIVRGSDYHVDFVTPAGERRRGAKIPFEWRRLSSPDKQAFIDSVTLARERLLSVPSRSSAAAKSRSDASTPAQPMMLPAKAEFVSPAELPDYVPAFLSDAARADRAGNLWLRTVPTRAIHGGSVYDVIDSQGRLTDRVQLPANTEILGFGYDGSVYLVTRPSSSGESTTLRSVHLR